MPKASPIKRTSPTSDGVKHKACDGCRSRKLACSKDHNGCTRCLREGLKCIYSLQKRMGRPPKDRFDSSSPGSPKNSNSNSTSRRRSNTSRRISLVALSSSRLSTTATVNSSPSSSSGTGITKSPETTTTDPQPPYIDTLGITEDLPSYNNSLFLHSLLPRDLDLDIYPVSPPTPNLLDSADPISFHSPSSSTISRSSSHSPVPSPCHLPLPALPFPCACACAEAVEACVKLTMSGMSGLSSSITAAGFFSEQVRRTGEMIDNCANCSPFLTSRGQMGMTGHLLLWSMFLQLRFPKVAVAQQVQRQQQNHHNMETADVGDWMGGGQTVEPWVTDEYGNLMVINSRVMFS